MEPSVMTGLINLTIRNITRIDVERSDHIKEIYGGLENKRIYLGKKKRVKCACRESDRGPTW